MSFKIRIDEDFIKKQIQKFCKDHRKNRSGLYKLNCPKNGVCNLGIEHFPIEWGKCAKFIGSCIIGDQFENDWIDTTKKNKLIGCINSFTNIDWLLHLSQKRYRDHASHQLFVGVLGWFLLRCKLESSNSNNDESYQTLGRWIGDNLHLSKEDVDIAWWIASLFHDHAYPLSHMLRIVPSVVKENREPLINQTFALLGFKKLGEGSNSFYDVFKGLYENNFLKSLRNEINVVQTKTQFTRNKICEIIKYYLIRYNIFSENELSNVPENCYDHGILAATNLAALINLPDSRPNSIMKAAIRAIGIHNGAVCKEYVNIKTDPLAFLLILCDQCQEWGRRIVIEDEVISESNHISLHGLNEKNNSEEYKISNCIKIIFEYSDANCIRSTGWDYSLFSRSKEEAFGRLHVSSDFPIEQLEYHVLIPHAITFKGKK